MKASWKKLVSILVLLAAGLPLHAADLLFVFSDDAGTAAVFDSATLKPLAYPAAGFGARQVFGIPDASTPGAFSKFFVLGRDAIVVLDAQFQVRRTLSLQEPATAGTLAAAGSRLLVAAGHEIVLLDTTQEQIVGTVPLEFTVRALAPAPGMQSVYVLAENSPLLRELNLETLQLDAAAGWMPQVLTGMVAAPSGSLVYGVAGDALYDLRNTSPVRISSQSEPSLLLSSGAAGDGGLKAGPAPAANPKFAVADSGRYVMVSGGRVYSGWLSGRSASSQVNIANAGLAGVRDAAVSSDGRTLFAAGSGSLSRIELDNPATAQTASLSFEASSVALVSPTASQSTGTLEQVPPLQLTVAGTKSFSLTVKAVGANGAPQSNVTVFVSDASPATPAVNCFSNVTDAQGLAEIFCNTGEVAAATLVRITVSDTAGRTAPAFQVTLTPPTATEGLTKVSGDFETVPENADFDLVVSATKDRLAQKNLGLTITAVPSRPTVNCPSQVFTDLDGLATIVCHSGIVSNEETGQDDPVDVEITASDGARSVLFTVTIDPNKSLREGLAKVSGDGQRVAQGVALPAPLVVRSVIGGVPQVKTVLTISVSNSTALTCPSNVLTDTEGFGFIACRGGTVFGEQTVQVTIGGPAGSQVTFSVVVRASSSGIATELAIVTAGPIQGMVGEVRDNGIRVVATESGGGRVAGKTVYFSSEDGVTFNPPTAVTDGLGEATTQITFGCANRNRGSIEVGFSATTEEDSIDFTLRTGTFAKIDKLQGDNQTGAPGQTLSAAALVVQVGDICGNPITQQKVTWRVNPKPRATFRNLVDTTNQSGRSSTIVQLGSYGGPFTVTAQAGEVMATFNVNVALDASQLKKLSGDQQSTPPGSMAAQPLVVEVDGTNGFGVSNVDVTFAVTQGGATLTRATSKTDGLGVAFTGVRLGEGGPATVTATAAGKTVAFTLKPGAGGGMSAPLAGFVNGASFQPGWVPGSLGSIFGTGITGISGIVAASEAPFPTSLEGVSVTVNGVPAPIISLVNQDGQEQINLQVPFGIPAGTTTVVIDNNGSPLTVENVPIRQTQPGIFEFFLGPAKFAAALRHDYSVVTPENPAAPGEVIALYLTGLGPTSPAVQTNTPGPVPAARTATDPIVGFDNAGVENFGAYYAPGLITAYQINFRVPADATPGNHEINIAIGGATSPKAVIAVGP